MGEDKKIEEGVMGKTRRLRGREDGREEEEIRGGGSLEGRRAEGW